MEMNFRESDSQLGHASPKKFRSKQWSSFVKSMAFNWREMNLHWAKSFKNKPGDLFVVSYEDLVRDTERVLLSVLSFLGVKVTDPHYTNGKSSMLGCPESLTSLASLYYASQFRNFEFPGF